MKKTVSLGLILISLIITLCFSGCIGSDPIVGSWEESRTGAKIVFNADNTATVNIKGSALKAEMNIPAEWDNKGDGLYTITYGSGSSAATYTLQMSKNGKTMTSGFGYLQETYIKVS